MQAYAEGWELLDKVDVVDNVTEVFRSWREGTVIRSWLLDLLVAALDQDPDLAQISGYAEDSGEGRWTVEAGIDNAVATPAITAALYARFVSRQDDSPAMKAVAAMRNQFGGHAMRTGAPKGGDAPARAPPTSRARRSRRAPGIRRNPPRASPRCTSRASSCSTSAPTARSTSRSSRGPAPSWVETARARPISSRRSTTSPGWPPTGSPRTRPW